LTGAWKACNIIQVADEHGGMLPARLLQKQLETLKKVLDKNLKKRYDIKVDSSGTGRRDQQVFSEN